MSEKNKIIVDMNKVQKKCQNHFFLTSLIAKRARQLQEGGKPLLNKLDLNEPYNFIDAALKELELGLIKIEKKELISEENIIIDELDKDLEKEVKKKEIAEKKKDKKDKKKNKSRSLAA